MSPNIKVIDNVISRAYQNHIEDTIGGTEYPWFYEPKITYVVEDSDPNSGFSNGIYFKEGIKRNEYKGEFYNLVVPILLQAIDKYQPGVVLKELFRIRSVMFIKNQNTSSHVRHVDMDDDHYNMVYYVNDSDGPTRIFSESKVIKEVNPKKGRALIFPGNYYHSSDTPKKNSRRVILNYNFLI